VEPPGLDTFELRVELIFGFRPTLDVTADATGEDIRGRLESRLSLDNVDGLLW
jgi:hypothetical protein